MSGPLSGKVALVTGASRGIGRAIALRLARDGAQVAVNYANNMRAADAVVAEIEKAGGQALAVSADVSQVSEIRRLFSQTVAHFSGLDILVNNAGHASFGPIADVPEKEFDRLFALNVKGVYFAMQEAARHLRDGGRIVNLSSGITQLGSPGGALYGGTKGAVEQFTMAVARELAPRGITVNTVSPGMTDTDLLAEVIPTHVQLARLQDAPFGRLGTPQDIADVVAFLVSDGGRWITGQNLRATGGAT